MASQTLLSSAGPPRQATSDIFTTIANPIPGERVFFAVSCQKRAAGVLGVPHEYPGLATVVKRRAISPPHRKSKPVDRF